MDWFLLLMPLIGFMMGMVKDYRFIEGIFAVKLLIGSFILFSIYLVSSMSFSIDILDWLVMATGLFAIGYGGTRLKSNDSGINRRLVLGLKAVTILFYCAIPIALLGILFISYHNNWLGKTVGIDKSNNYTIKHVCKNSNFTFSGYHYANIYKKVFLVEYQVDQFQLGQYGEFGFDSFSVEDDGSLSPLNKFEYDPKRQVLTVYQNRGERYIKEKEFDSGSQLNNHR